MNAARSAACFLLILAIALCACETETRLIGYKPMLGGLPGADSTTPVTPPDLPEGATVTSTDVPVDKLVNEDRATKKKTIIARTPRHVMIHVYNTLRDNDAQLFWDEVLCKQTRDEFADRGMGPEEAMQRLRDRQQDLSALFNTMPMGELTPGVFVKPVGGGAQRLEVTGLAARDLNWTGFDYVSERGNYRLRWFVGPYP